MVYSIDFQWAGLHNAHDRRAHWGTMEQCTEHLQHFTIGGQYIYYEVQCEIGSRCAVWSNQLVKISTNISTIWIHIENLLKWPVNIAERNIDIMPNILHFKMIA